MQCANHQGGRVLALGLVAPPGLNISWIWFETQLRVVRPTLACATRTAPVTQGAPLSGYTQYRNKLRITTIAILLTRKSFWYRVWTYRQTR